MFNEAIDARPKGCALELTRVEGGWLARIERKGRKWAAKDVSPVGAVEGAVEMMRHR